MEAAPGLPCLPLSPPLGSLSLNLFTTYKEFSGEWEFWEMVVLLRVLIMAHKKVKKSLH